MIHRYRLLWLKSSRTCETLACEAFDLAVDVGGPSGVSGLNSGTGQLFSS